MLEKIIHPTQKVWFALIAFISICIGTLLLKILNNLPSTIVSAQRKQELSSILTGIFAKIIFLLNPQIKVNLLNNWDLKQDQERMVIVINHVSYLDIMLLYAVFPLTHVGKVRSLFKADLLDVPFFGEIFRWHFPVHFVSSAPGKFSVDKDKQLQVMQDIQQHLKDNGHLVVFPEGRINRRDIKKLDDFRKGIFEAISEIMPPDEPDINLPNQKTFLTMFSFLHQGLEQSFPPQAMLGGKSTTITCKISSLSFSKGMAADQVQKLVQQDLDSINHHLNNALLHRPTVKA